jgi:DNA repair protein SbcD/Mre11
LPNIDMSASGQSELETTGRILALGDIHLGTRCSGLPDKLQELGVDPNDLTPAAALAASVNMAIENKVDAVLFAGDVVESTNARFEAMVPFEENVRRLLEAGIQVIAVAGNHDVEALPRLAGLIEGFDLLGAKGRWESRAIIKGERTLAEIVGWSFPELRVRQSPIAQLLDKPLDDLSTAVPRIGLLHADLGASGGHYAPIRQVELDNTGYDAWLLGHIHKPSLQSTLGTSARTKSGYLGSLVGLDATETGIHGPWLLTISSRGEVDFEHIPLAPLRWEYLSVSVEDVDTVEDVPDRLLAEAERLVRRLYESGATPRALGLRVRLEGTSDHSDEIDRHIADDKWNDLSRVVDGTCVFINKIINSITLPVDLKEIATGDDPAALLAQRILSLESRDTKSEVLLATAREHLRSIVDEEPWRPLENHRSERDPLSDEPLRETLLQAGKAALHAMLRKNAEREAT